MQVAQFAGRAGFTELLRWRGMHFHLGELLLDEGAEGFNLPWRNPLAQAM